jgi:hypothetical protein
MLYNRARAMTPIVVVTLGADRARADLLYVFSKSVNPGSVPAIARIDTTTGQQTPFVATLPGGIGTLGTSNL